MALKIVRSESQLVESPLRLWRAGRQDEALEQLARPEAGRHAEEAGQIAAYIVASGDLQPLPRLGEVITRWDDDIAAYRLTKTVSERLIDGFDTKRPQEWWSRALCLIDFCLPTLQQTPWEPVLLNYVGVAAYGLNEPALALRLFEAAGRLESDVENLHGNISAARHRLAHPISLPLTPALRARVGVVRPALRRLVGRAGNLPRQGTISLCMIVRDEEEMLPDCLASVRGIVDEIVIVDTGSTDGTVAIAAAAGARVLEFPWNGSFSDARNHGLAAATGDFILWLDADERLEDGDGPALRELTRQPWREAHWMVEVNYIGQAGAGTAATHMALRLWRNRSVYRFSGVIHEQIRSAMPVDLGERFGPSTVRLRHYGYLKARIDARAKHERNLTLLLPELERNPNSPFVHFNIGTEYLVGDRIDKAVPHLEQALSLLRREEAWENVAYAPLLGSRTVGARRMLGDVAGADALAAELLHLWPEFTDLVFERAICALGRHDLEAADELFERCLRMGDSPARLSGIVGRGSFLALVGQAQVAAARDDRGRSIEVLERTLREHSSYLLAVLDLAHMLLADDGDPQEALERIDALGHEEMTWSLYAGTAFYECGHAVEAETFFRRALALAPAQPAARVGLAEALLSQHRYAEIEQEAIELPIGTPAQSALSRQRALAGMLVGDDEATEAAIQSLEAAGESDEACALRPLASVMRGQDHGANLPAGALTYLLRMLDALARLEEFDAFGRAVVLVDAVSGDRRGIRLALGELYLARGFYRLAADTALRVVEMAGPDAQTLALLGRSAVAEGLFDDAVPVLEASLELDPTQLPVRRLLEQVRVHLAA